MKKYLKKLIILLIICITTVSCIGISGCEQETETELFPIGVYDGENLLYTEYSEEEPAVGPMMYLYDVEYNLIGTFYYDKEYKIILEVGKWYIVRYDFMSYAKERGFYRQEGLGYEANRYLLRYFDIGQLITIEPLIEWERIEDSEYCEFYFHCDGPRSPGTGWICANTHGMGGCTVEVTFE